MNSSGCSETGGSCLFLVPKSEDVGALHEVLADLPRVFSDGRVDAVLNIVLLRSFQIQVQSGDVGEGHSLCERILLLLLK